MDDAILHKLWTKAVGKDDYVKEEWKELERLVWREERVSEEDLLALD